VSSCEKCWADSRMPGVGPYHQLVAAREFMGVPCTPEQQAGPDAGECPTCKRKTLHQHTGDPMCGCSALQHSEKP
jgi:hypothetical protein